MSVTNHGYLGYLVVMSKKFWKSLPQDMKDVIQKAMKEATVKEREFAQELDKSQFEKIKEYAKKSGKLQITVLTPEQIGEWKKVMEKIYPKFYNPKLIGKDLIESAQKVK